MEKNSKIQENSTEMKEDIILKTERTYILGTTYITMFYTRKFCSSESM